MIMTYKQPHVHVIRHLRKAREFKHDPFQLTLSARYMYYFNVKTGSFRSERPCKFMMIVLKLKSTSELSIFNEIKNKTLEGTFKKIIYLSTAVVQ